MASSTPAARLSLVLSLLRSTHRLMDLFLWFVLHIHINVVDSLNFQDAKPLILKKDFSIVNTHTRKLELLPKKIDFFTKKPTKAGVCEA